MKKKTCSICGRNYGDTMNFKSGYVCEHCLDYLREKYDREN